MASSIPAIYALAGEIAKRFAAIAPRGFSCIAFETAVVLTYGHRGIRHFELADAEVFDWSEASWADELKSVTWRVLNDFQDAIVEHSRAAWPAVGTGGLAVPRSAIEDGGVLGWYGTDTGVVPVHGAHSARHQG